METTTDLMAYAYLQGAQNISGVCNKLKREKEIPGIKRTKVRGEVFPQ